MPIPAGAGVIAAVVHFQSDGDPIRFLVYRHHLACHGDRGRLSDGQHLAFLQLQRYRFPSRHPFRLIILLWRFVRRHLVFFQACAFRGSVALYVLRRVLALAMDIPPRGKRPPPPTYKEASQAFMSSPSKSRNPAPSSTRGQLYRAAIVGAGSLRGKEVAEMLSERNFPAVDVRLLDDDESIGQLEATGDEINFIQSVRSEQFDKNGFHFLRRR